MLRSYQFPRKCFHAGKCPTELYMRLESLMREKSDFNYRESVAVICSILARIRGEESITSRDAGLTGRAKDICSIHYQDPTFDINTLAAVLKVNRWTLRRVFRRYLNTTPSEFLFQMRMNNAMKLLRATRKPIAKIAGECGFSDTSYFCKVIRETTGVSPSRLRGL